MKVTVEKVTYDVWGNCIKITNGKTEAFITVDFGPRIIRYAFAGGENMLKEDKERSIHESGKCFDVYGENDGWYIYGGHRMWLSPEAMPATYYPDNESVAYEITENGAVFVPNCQKWTNMQHTLSVTMCPESGRLSLVHTVENKGAHAVNAAAWDLTVMSQGGMEVVPMPDRQTGYLHNRKLALWAYTKMNDARVYWGEKYIVLKQDPSNTDAFKVGLPNEKGWAMYFNHNNLFIKKFTHQFDATYPDDGMSYETYTNNAFLEMESISPYKLLSCGESIQHSETWELYADVSKPDKPTVTEDRIDEIVKQYIKN